MRMKVNQSRSLLPRPVQPAKISSLGDDQKDLSLSERDWNLPLYTAISRKVVGKNVPVTIPKGNMGYDQYTAFKRAHELFPKQGLVLWPYSSFKF